MATKPWIPNEAAHIRSMGWWKSLRKTHKRHPNTEVSFQAWISYSIRFIRSGDITSAWKTFGGVADQLSHLGEVLNIATLENATIAMTYDAKVRTYAGELFKARDKDSEIIALLTNEDQRLKRETLRDCGFAQTSECVPNKESKRTTDKGGPKTRDARQENKRKGKVNGQNQRRTITGDPPQMTGPTRGHTVNETTGANPHKIPPIARPTISRQHTRIKPPRKKRRTPRRSSAEW